MSHTSNMHACGSRTVGLEELLDDGGRLSRAARVKNVVRFLHSGRLLSDSCLATGFYRNRRHRTNQLSTTLGTPTALLHHVTAGLLRDSYYALKRHAAPGVDGVTWKEPETGPDESWQTWLVDLHSRIQRGTYRAQPSKRACIPKADGRQRSWALQPLRTKSFRGPW
jgi:hypothetical protein